MMSRENNKCLSVTYPGVSLEYEMTSAFLHKRQAVHIDIHISDKALS